MGRGARMMCELFNWLQRKGVDVAAVAALRHLRTSPSVYVSCMTCHSMFFIKNFNEKLRARFFLLPAFVYACENAFARKQHGKI